MYRRIMGDVTLKSNVLKMEKMNDAQPLGSEILERKSP